MEVYYKAIEVESVVEKLKRDKKTSFIPGTTQYENCVEPIIVQDTFLRSKTDNTSIFQIMGNIYVDRVMRRIIEGKNEKFNISDAIQHLRDGIMIRNTLALVEMALICVISPQLQADWDLADSFLEFVDPNCVWDVANEWKEAAEMGIVEGYVAHFLLLRHRKLLKSPLGDIYFIMKQMKLNRIKMPNFDDGVYYEW